MADFNKYYPFLASSEGGLSADPNDKSAAAYPSHYVMTTGKWKGYKVHTNRGVTYRTFIANAKAVGLKPDTPTFINLSYEQAKKFYKVLFWDDVYGDLIKSQAVAEILAEAGVGSVLGLKRMIKDLQLGLKQLSVQVNYTGKIDKQTLTALNSINSTTEQNLIKYLTQARLNFLKSLKVWNTYATTWSRRVASTYDRASSYVA